MMDSVDLHKILQITCLVYKVDVFKLPEDSRRLVKSLPQLVLTFGFIGRRTF